MVYGAFIIGDNTISFLQVVDFNTFDCGPLRNIVNVRETLCSL